MRDTENSILNIFKKKIRSIRTGGQGGADNLRACALGEHWEIEIPTPEEDISATDLCLRLGLKVDVFERLMGKGIVTIVDLVLTMSKSEKWYQDIYGVGAKTAEDIEKKLEYFGYGRTG